MFTIAPQLDALLAAWRDAWPKALACWSRFVQLTEPRWCLDVEEEKRGRCVRDRY